MKLFRKDEIKNPFIAGNPLMLLLYLEENADTLTIKELFELRDSLDNLATSTNIVANFANPELNTLSGKEVEACFLTSYLIGLQTVTTDKYLNILEQRVNELRNKETPKPYSEASSHTGGGLSNDFQRHV